MGKAELEKITKHWKTQWSLACKVWSIYVRLREPHWSLTDKDSAEQGLLESFAMIRLVDHRIVINIKQAIQLGVEKYALQILAHEIGHHIYTPANLTDNARILAKIRWALIDVKDQAPMIANLYEDLLINDRLHSAKGLDMAVIYRQINRNNSFSKLWTLYMRAYEYLWRLKKFDLIPDQRFHSDTIDADASLIAALVKSYSKNWIDGASRFAALLYPYLIEEKEIKEAKRNVVYVLDADNAGQGGGTVAGMTEFDGEIVVDPRSEAIGAAVGDDKDSLDALREALDKKGGEGPQQRYLDPGSYVDLMRQVNPDIDKQEIIIRYYKEIALPHLIDFPIEAKANQSMTLPEGLDVWDLGDSADEVDWLETAIHAPLIIPGVNTLKRTYGPSDDEEEKATPLDVYIGVDCSGSMGNPARQFSWPIMAATVVALSALRAGAKVMPCLSGEPGRYMQTDDYKADEKEVMSILTSYLGTGYAFGVGRLKEPFINKLDRKSHIIIVTDDDIFSMLNAKTDNGDNHWDIIEQSLHNAGGIGTLVLDSNPKWHKEETKKLEAMGWHIYYVTNEQEMLDFARDFSQQNYKA